MYKMKYAIGLKLLCCIGRISKYLYFTKKVLCIGFVVIVAILGLNLLAGGKCGMKSLKGML